MNRARKTRSMHEIAEQQVPETLDLWTGIRSRVESSARVGRARGGLGQARGGRRLVGLAAMVLLALAIGGSFLWNQPEPVSAEAILARVQSAETGSTDTRSYHRLTVYRTGLQADQVTTSEEWISGDRIRRRYQTSDATGGVVRTLEYVYDGSREWSVTDVDGQVRVYRTVGPGKPDAGKSAGLSSLSDLLALWNHDQSCMSAKLRGEETIIGRATYVISVKPRPDACPPFPSANEPGAKAPPPPTEEEAKMIEEKMRYVTEEMLLWVDKESYQSLKTISLTKSGLVLDDYAVTSFEYGIDIPDSVFAYAPPAGATVVDNDLKSESGKAP